MAVAAGFKFVVLQMLLILSVPYTGGLNFFQGQGIKQEDDFLLIAELQHS